MSAQSVPEASTLSTASATPISERYSEGLAAGAIGAATIALWFFILDLMAGRPLYTPTLLGTALFQGLDEIAAPATMAPAFEPALLFTWVHFLVFGLVGGLAAQLLGVAERDPNYGFGIVIFFVVFAFGFIVGAMLFAEPVLHALTWPAILLGNVLAGGTMGLYFRRRHPSLTILP